MNRTAIDVEPIFLLCALDIGIVPLAPNGKLDCCSFACLSHCERGVFPFFVWHYVVFVGSIDHHIIPKIVWHLGVAESSTCCLG